MSTVTIKRNDTARKLADTLTLNGAPINLAGCTVSLCISDGTTSTKRAATIVSAAAGTVEVQLEAADVDTAGKFAIEWEIVFPNGKHLSVPSDDHHVLHIVADLA